jgi:hypothetical protein
MKERTGCATERLLVSEYELPAFTVFADLTCSDCPAVSVANCMAPSAEPCALRRGCRRFEISAIQSPFGARVHVCLAGCDGSSSQPGG